MKKISPIDLKVRKIKIMRNRSLFRNRLFWLILFSLILSISFVFYGQHLGIVLFEEKIKRVLYGSIFFFLIIVSILLYLLFTKPEERERRIAQREARREEKRIAKEKLKIKKSAINALKKKFYESLGIVRKSAIYKKRANYNYELPWYLVLGGEDQEQESILKHSGLDFPINIEYKDRSEESYGTFKWFFAEEGVFVTIPKDYVTLDKNNEAHPIWLTFLKLFKKERWRRPINGIIFTINAKEIINKSEAETNEYAKVVREKINEISKTFSAKIPVYMIVTGLENIPGFYKFFNNLTLEEKREILGITFEDNIQNISKEVIESKIANLLQKLENETLSNIHSSWEKEERKQVFFFLEDLQHFLIRISTFSEKIFSKTRYYSPIMLRGIYFTDISHGTTTHYAVTRQGDQITSGLFTPKIFERIILSETQLAKINDEYRKKFSYFWIAIFTALILILGSIIYYWTNFVQDESREVKKIEDIYGQYVSLQENSKPKVTLVRKAPDLKDAIEIGRLGGDSNGEVNFVFAKATLTPVAEQKLKRVIDAILALDESTKIKIVGHTDSIGSDEYNLELSLARANAVKNFFKTYGIDGDRITTEGKGESRPIANNQTVEGRSLNRRVEIYAYGVSKQNTNEDNSFEYKESYIIENELTELQRILAMLDALRSMRRDENDTIHREAWKPGFWKISERDIKVKSLYSEGLEKLLLPHVAAIIEKNLLTSLKDKIQIQNNLKAYLMLADSSHRDIEFLENYMQNRWGDLQDREIRRLNIHFDALMHQRFRPAKLNQKSIKKARKKLLFNGGVAGLVYRLLQEEISQEDIPDFQFLEILDSFPNALEGAEYKIPGFYSKEGYEKIILVKAKIMIKDIMQKNWILGDKDTIKDREINRIFEKVLNLYFVDYRKHWTKALAQLHVPERHTSSELTEQLELLSSSVSPIIYVLRAFKENTYLLTPKEKANLALKIKRESQITMSEVAGRLGSKLDRLQHIGTRTMQAFVSDKMVYDLRSIFKPYHELLDKENNPSRKFKMVLRHVEKVYQAMLVVDTSMDPQKSAFEIVSKTKSGSDDIFKLKSNLLPPTLLGWYNQSLSNSWNYLTKLVDGHVDRTYNDEIWSFYEEKIKGRFPVDPRSSRDIALDDFKSFFKKNGLLDSFYAKYVKPFVNINYQTGKYKLRSIDGSKIAIDKQMIKSMMIAKKIQKLFFQSDSGELHFEVDIAPKSLSINLASMDIVYEDQALTYEHGPIQKKTFVWPAKYPTSAAKFTFYDMQSNRVVKIRGEGAWGLLRLFAKLQKNVYNFSHMKIGYSQNGYSGYFDVYGDITSYFFKRSSIRNFRLKKIEQGK